MAEKKRKVKGADFPDTISDESQDGAYFHLIYNMADDDLDPFEYRLYGHYKRVCGEAGTGKCWESVRTTAQKTHMSAASVSRYRKTLAEKGYVTIEERPDDTDIIRIVNRMAENVARYAIRVSQGNDVFPTETTRFSQKQDVSQGNTPVSVGNQRITIEEEPIKNNQAAKAAHENDAPETIEPAAASNLQSNSSVEAQSITPVNGDAQTPSKVPAKVSPVKEMDDSRVKQEMFSRFVVSIVMDSKDANLLTADLEDFGIEAILQVIEDTHTRGQHPRSYAYISQKLAGWSAEGKLKSLKKSQRSNEPYYKPLPGVDPDAFFDPDAPATEDTNGL